MKILYVSSEGAPFSASGGLGDVIGALPKSIAKKDRGVSVSIVLPLYGNMDKKYSEALKHEMDIAFNLSWRATGAAVYSLNVGRVKYYFIDNKYYFDRARTYGEYDDGERFAFFSMAVIEWLLRSEEYPEILHANDWQSALTVIYLKTKYSENPKLSKIRTVFTIHNIEYQGKYDIRILEDVFALDKSYLGTVEYDGCINLLKGALTVSDYITTVSPNYKKELSDDRFAFGLGEVIKSVSEKMKGIINGIDYETFSPKGDADIYYPFDRRNVKRGKSENKAALSKDLGLYDGRDVPLIGMVTRLADSKGIDLVLHIIDELLCENINMVILGTGEERYEKALSDVMARHDNFKAIFDFNRGLSKKIYAASDIFLMPSRSEPCGLAQMVACSYGAVPIVRAVGGLYDTIRPYGLENYNGFTFSDYNAHELLFTVKSALNLYRNSEEWNLIRKSAMNSRFTWDDSAGKYMEIYNKILNW